MQFLRTNSWGRSEASEYSKCPTAYARNMSWCDEPARRDVAIGYRISNALLIGAVAGLVCYWMMMGSRMGAGDFHWALDAAAALKAGINPYSLTKYGHDIVPYPLTAALFAFPFLSLRPEVAAAVFMGISSAVLGFAVTKRGHRYMLVFLSYPFWAAVAAAQWSPLLMAGALLPWVFPVVIAKPNVGMAIAATKGTLTKFAACAIGVAATFVMLPQWPALWLHQTHGYQSFVPLLSRLGAPLVLTLLWRYDEDSQTLLAMSLAPQRWYYDALPLWLIPDTVTELLGASLISWAALLLTPMPRTIHDVEVISMVSNYLPMLLIVAARRWGNRMKE